MTAQAIYDALRAHPLFSSWEEAPLHTLIGATTLRTYHVGEPLWCEGEEGQSAFILINGCVERSRYARPQGRRETQYSEPGTLLSTASLVHPWAHTSTCKPTSTAQVLELNRHDYEELFEAQDPAAYLLVDAIAQNVVEEMRDANARVHQVFGRPAETLRNLRRRVRPR